MSETHDLVARKVEFGSYRNWQEAIPFWFGPRMSWGVYDYTAMETVNNNLPRTGGHFTSIPSHKYLVVLRVEDWFGIEQITLDGQGMFEAMTEPDQNGTAWTAPQHLPASIPHQEYDFGGAGNPPKLQDLIVTLPDIGAWEYDRLSCGVHHYGGPPKALEYFAVDGTMTFTGTSKNTLGFERTASLTTSP